MYVDESDMLTIQHYMNTNHTEDIDWEHKVISYEICTSYERVKQLVEKLQSRTEKHHKTYWTQ